MIYRAYKYRLYPNKQQEILLSKHFGCVRYIYNWALALKIETYKTKQKIENFYTLGTKLPKLKQENEWLKEINAQSLQSALKNVDNAFNNFFKKKSDFPKFKSKKKNKNSFHVPQSGKIDFVNNLLSIPKIRNIKIIIDRPFNEKIKTITISKTSSEKYYASIHIEEQNEISTKPPIKENTTIGIDVGLKTYATISTGEKIDNPRWLRKSQKKLKYQQYILSKMDNINKKKEGKNRDKQKKKLARAFEKVRNQRDDFLHKLTHKLTHDNQVDTIVVEDLSISNMMKNHSLAGSIGDVSWGRFFQFLTYKCEWYGKNLITIGRFDPSSKLCSCGVINSSLKLSDREWTCGSCGVTHDRDVLAANNIKHFGLLRQNKIGQEVPELTPMETGMNFPS